MDSDIGSETMKMDADGASNADSSEATMKGTIDVGDGDSGLPSRMAIDMTRPGQDGSLKMTSEILEYDVPVNAEAPPDDNVIENPPG